MEPVYNYVKGAGWVPSIYETCTAIIGKYRVTVSSEKPQEGDYWGHMGVGSTIQKFLAEISEPRYAHYFNEVPTSLQLYRGNTGWHDAAVKLTLELL